MVLLVFIIFVTIKKCISHRDIKFYLITMLAYYFCLNSHMFEKAEGKSSIFTLIISCNIYCYQQCK